MNYGQATEMKIAQVLSACERDGDRSIIALAGVPGTGKSFVAAIAAQRFANEPTRVREIQFHQSMSYEDFVEGLRITSDGSVTIVPGIFLEMNQLALDDPERRYVLLVEELTRANVPAVLGELMTYLEYRNRGFTTVYSRRPVKIARNLTVIATYNPTDRSAIDLDNALLRRMRVLTFPPDVAQLAEMLESHLSAAVISRLQNVFLECKKKHGERFLHLMPFGHGVFATVENEAPDLHELWRERLMHMVRRPLVQPHPFVDTIEEIYGWKEPNFRVEDDQ